MVVVDLNLPCAVSARFTYHWWWMCPAILSSPFTVDMLTRFANALVTISPMLQVIKAIPRVKEATFVAKSSNKCWLVFPHIPHGFYNQRVFIPSGRIVPPSTLNRSGKNETIFSNDIFCAFIASVNFGRRSFSILAAVENDFPGPSASRSTSAYGRS